MRVVILCGGMGRRAHPLTEDLPKPLLPIGGQPILLHLMQVFADQGHTDFVLAVGYRQQAIRDQFSSPPHGWHIEIVDTGDAADTGARLHGCRHLLGETFLATYGDGLADIRLEALLSFHAAHGGLTTVTSTPLACQYGTVEADETGRVLAFREKPILRQHWINAGFMVMDPAVFDHWAGESLEREVLPALARKGLVYTYRHDGFFKSLDSAKDQQEFDELLRSGKAPWQLDPSSSTP